MTLGKAKEPPKPDHEPSPYKQHHYQYQPESEQTGGSFYTFKSGSRGGTERNKS